MKTMILLSGLALCAMAVPSAAHAAPPILDPVADQPQDQSRTDQRAARRDMRAGGQMWTLRQIERRILPDMRGAEYLGPTYDSEEGLYRLRFIRNGRVIDIYVRASDGQVVRQTPG